MKLKVRVFSVLKDYLGGEHVEVEVPDGVLAGELMDVLSDKLPGLREARRRVPIILLVNGEIAGGDRRVRDDDEIALVPPSSGG